MTKTPYKRLNKYAFDKHRFENVREAEKFIRTKNTSPDYIAIAGVLFTMEEYDNDGQQILYANRRNGLTVELRTTARYSNGFKDAELEIYPSSSYRNDLVYAD